jgi:hypothetical protein
MRNEAWVILSFVLFFAGVASAEPKLVQNAGAKDYTSGEGELLIKKLKEQAKEKEEVKRKKDEPAYFEMSKEDAAMEGRNRIIQGTVSGISSSGIAVEYEVSEKDGSSKEKWFPFVKGVNFNGFKKFRDLQLGDKVSVVYKESVDEKKRFLKGVTLVEKKPKPTAEELAAEKAADAKAAAEEAPQGGTAQ